MTHLVANMVGRNEEHKYLVPVLERLATQVDKIVFTDDCSEDNTAEVAASFGAEVFVMDKPTFDENEGALRQQSWENLETVLPSKDCFILAIDCDEMLYETGHKIKDLITQTHFDVINIEFFHMWNETQFRVDKAWHPHPSSRLFRYFEGGLFANRKLACGSEPIYVQHLIRQRKYLQNSGLRMKHLSYIKDEDKEKKFIRYMNLDGGAFHANAHILSIMDENPTLVDWYLK